LERRWEHLLWTAASSDNCTLATCRPARTWRILRLVSQTFEHVKFSFFSPVSVSVCRHSRLVCLELVDFFRLVY
jgi:hypothetical protein